MHLILILLVIVGAIIIAPYVIIYMIRKYRLVKINEKQADLVMEKLHRFESKWNKEKISQFVYTFHEEFELAKLKNLNGFEYKMSEKSFLQEQKYLEYSTVLESHISKLNFVKINDASGDYNDFFKVLLEFDGRKIEIDKYGNQTVVDFTYEELWTFNANYDNWILTEIDKDVTLSDLKELKKDIIKK